MNPPSNRRGLRASLVLAAVLALTVTTANAQEGDAPAADDRRAALDRAVAEQVGGDQMLPTVDGDWCPTEQIRVTFERIPAEQIELGGYIDALVEPGADDTTATGIATCGDDHRAVTGFDAFWEDGAWAVHAMPVDDHTEDEAFLEAAREAHGTATPTDRDTGTDDGEATSSNTEMEDGPTGSSLSSTSDVPVPSYPAGLPATADPLAAYDGQDQCFTTVQPGTQALGDLITNTYASNQSWYSLRGCYSGGTSEHKEGRALDWFVDAYDADERAIGDRFTRWLTEPDPFGNAYGGVRRMGVMYIVWNQQTWGSWNADQGWRSYTGSSPHTDHVHISLSWPGADCETTWWQATDCTGEVTTVEPPIGFDVLSNADVDGDGRDEYLLYDRSNGKAEVWRASASGELTDRLAAMQFASGWDSIEAGDVDGNGRDEYVFHRATGSYAVYSTTTSGTLGSRLTSQELTGGWDHLAFGDLRPGAGDELVLLRSSDRTVRATTTSSSGAPASTLVTAKLDVTASSIATSDTDGNGWDSLALYDAATGATRLVDVTASGTLSTPRWSTSLATGWSGFHGADLDGDGDDEWVFSRDATDQVVVYSGGVEPSPGQTLSSATLGSSLHVAGADVDGSGRPEHVHYEPATGDLTVTRATSTGAMGATLSAYRVGKGWDNVVAGDFDGDGVDDLLFHRVSNGQVAVYTTTDTGRLRSRLAAYQVAGGWDDLVTADFRGHDGPSLVFHRSSTGQVVAYTATATGRLGSRTAAYGIASGWGEVATGDADADGVDELMFHRDRDGLLVRYTTRSDGRLAWLADASRLDATVLALEDGDFDRDGDDEVVAYTVGSGGLRVHEGHARLSLGSRLAAMSLG